MAGWDHSCYLCMMKRSFSFFLHLVIFLSALPGCQERKNRWIRTEFVRIDSLEQVVLVGDSLVKPIIYTNVSGLDKYPHQVAKIKFISLVLPSILIAKHHLEERRERIYGLREKKDWNKSDSSFYFDS